MNRLAVLAIVCGLFSVSFVAAAEPDSAGPQTLTKSDVEAMMKSLSNWGRWGKNDELGTLNLITPEKRKQAAALVKDGITVSLARDVAKTPQSTPSAFQHKMIALPDSQELTSSGDEYTLAYHGFTQSHLDGLCHLFFKGQ